MTKKEARQQVKEWMKKLDKNYIEKADQSIFEQVKELMMDQVPTEEHDILMDQVICDE